MAQAVPLIVGAAIASSEALADYAFAQFLIMAGASVISGLMEQSMVDKPIDPGTLANTRSISEFIPILYGEKLIGGNDVDMLMTGDANKYLWIIQTLCEGEIDSIATISDSTSEWDGEAEIWYGDKHYKEFGSNISYWLFTGTASHDSSSDAGLLNLSQAILTDALAWESGEYIVVNKRRKNGGTLYRATQTHTTGASTEPGVGGSWADNWVEEGLHTENYRHTAFIVWKLEYGGDLRSWQDRTMKVKGKKLYDFRILSTVWSENPVLALYDFMTNTRYGLGIAAADLDAGVGESWDEAADYCDTKGFTISAFITGGDAMGIISSILSLFRGQLVWDAGIFYLRYSDLNEESSVMTITDDYIVQGADGSAMLSIAQPSRYSKPDALKGAFINPLKQDSLDHVFVGDSLGRVDSIDFSYASDVEHVGKLTTYALERMQLDRTVSGTFRDDCVALEPHDLVTFSSTAFGISSQIMRVVSTQIMPDGFIGLTLQYDNVDLYDDIYNVNEDAVYTSNLPDATFVYPPTAVTASGTTATTAVNLPIVLVTVSWTASIDTFVHHYVIEYSDDDITYINAGTSYDTTKTISGLTNGTWYFRVKAVNIRGIESAWATYQYTITETGAIALDFTMPSDEYLIGYWDMNEGEGGTAHDKSRYSNNGTFEGTSPEWSNGVSGKCFSAPGTNERIDCGSSAPLDDIGTTGTYPDVSVSFWMNGDSTPNNAGVMVMQFTDNDNLWAIRSQSTNNVLQVYIAKDPGTPETATGTFTDLNPFDDTWHFVCVVMDLTNDICRAYVDTVESAITLSLAGFTTGWDNAGSLSFGAYPGGAGPYDGLIDEVRIYSKALTAEEIRALYYIPSGNYAKFIASQLPSDGDLLGYWDFEAGSGTVCYDKSGNANNGTLINSPTWTTGIAGKCLSFVDDDAEYVDLDDNIMDVAAAFSISCWIWTDQTDAENNRIFTQIETGGDTLALVAIAENLIGLQTAIGATTKARRTTTTFSASAWHHIVVTSDSSQNYKAYIDGSEVDFSTSTSFTEPTVSGIGTHAGTTASSWNGKIDEVRVYNKVLTPLEIKALYANPSGNQSIVYGDMRLDGTYLVVGPNTARGEYETLEDALADLATMDADGIFIKPGTYTSSAQITLPSQNVRIIGQNRTGTILEGPGGSTLFFNIAANYNYSFESLTINSNNTSATSGIIYTGTTYSPSIYIKDCEIDGGSYARAFYGDVNGGDITIEGCKIINGISGSYNIITLDGFDSAKVSKNVFDINGSGPYGTNCDSLIITENSILADGEEGLDIGSGVVGVIISNNKIELTSGASRYYGIYCNGGSSGSINISNNSVILTNTSNAISRGIYIYNTSNRCVVSGNTVKTTNSSYSIYSIVIQNSDHVSVSGNSIVCNGGGASYTTVGIYFSNVSSSNIIGNHIDMTDNTANDYGIRLYTDCTYNTVAGNTTLNSGYAGGIYNQGGATNDTSSGNVDS